jgi:hypothetical protein
LFRTARGHNGTTLSEASTLLQRQSYVGHSQDTGREGSLYAAHGRSRLQVKLRCHMFRAIGITAGDTLENAQALATHESPRTTQLYV